MVFVSKELQEKQLQETWRKLLSLGRLVITPEWNYLTDDWVTCVAAADIDDDSDIEIVAGGRDGYVRALTRQGTERWKTSIGSWITSIAVIPSPSAQDLGEDSGAPLNRTGPLFSSLHQAQPRILVCTRDGRVCALDQQGKLLEWGELTAPQKGGQVLHQVAVYSRPPYEAVVGGEDRLVRLIDSATGSELGKYTLAGRVYGVCIADVDGDGEEEILAVSADKYIHILARSTTPTNAITLIERGKIKLNYKSYALAAAKQEVDVSNNGQENHTGRKWPALIFSSDKGKDLHSWTVVSQPRGQMKGLLTFNKTRLPRSQQQQQQTLQGRVLTIHTADINNDRQPEILVGSSDHFLYIFDQRGQLLWKQDFGHNIYSIDACDYDDDGLIEIVIGLGDNNIRAFKIELDPERYDHDLLLEASRLTQTPDIRLPLYTQMQQTVEKLHLLGIKDAPVPPGDALAELANTLGFLRDGEQSRERCELSVGEKNLGQHKYKEALSIFLRMEEQRVQRYWDEPLKNLGHIRDLDFGDVKGNPINEIIVGTDEGELIALNIDDEKKELWKPRPRVGSSVVSLATNPPQPRKHYETTFAVLEDGSLSQINNEGQLIDLPAHLLEPGDRVTSLYVKTSEGEGVQHIKYIALGLESQQICLYNFVQEQRQAVIFTEENISMVFVGDILGQQQLDILAATVEHIVILFTPDKQTPSRYTECWRYQAGDRIRGLRATDIDHDGHIEVIIGSEDRNLSVLNHLGELQWRYFMPDGVFSLDVYDCNYDGKDEILAGVDDGSVYILNYLGDLLLQIPVGDRVRVVRAQDLHPHDPQDSKNSYMQDNMIEIAVATDDRLMLFQMLPLDRIRELIERSWYLTYNNVEPLDLLYTYSDYQQQPDEYIRAFAIRRIAGQKEHRPEDFKHLRTVMAKDPSLLVAQKLANAIVNLCRTCTNDYDRRQSRQLLQQLARKPHREVRMAIVGMLDALAQVNKKLSFEYLNRFLRNEDLWLKRMVIRRLYKLISLDHRQVFSMLMISARDDKNVWIRQETGRALAHYFDYRYRHSAATAAEGERAFLQDETLFQDLHEILGADIDAVITQQIAISATEPAIKQPFAAYARFQKAIASRLAKSPWDNLLENLRQETTSKLFLEQKKNYQHDLINFVTALQDTMQIIPQVEDLLVVYQELLNILQVSSIEGIEQFRHKTEAEEMQVFRHFKDIEATLARMPEVVDEVKRYRKRQALSDQAATLLVAINLLLQIRQQYIAGRPGRSSENLLPEDALFQIALLQWYALLQQELRKLSGSAKLSIELVPNEVQRDETVEFSFILTNTGKSAADTVRVRIPENSSDYEVVGSPERMLPEVSTLRAQTTSFILKPLVESFRFPTEVVFDDAEKRNRVLKQWHHITLKTSRSTFKVIVNPYHGGTPISDSKMFYGRDEDLNTLREILSNTSTKANRVILLIGQRRSGKTSLIYQLASQLQRDVVVHIDLQDLAMSSNTAELFSNFVLKIQEAMLIKGFTPPPSNEFNFRENPSQTFDRYLKFTIQQLGGLRLILLFDEFEVFNDLIAQKRLDENFLHYLRSLMQHRLGINFLLAGAPKVLLQDLNNRSALLNIAQKHHLSRLKQEEATRLITEPVQNLVYDPQALELIHRLTGDQPYLIHLLCEELISYCNKHHKNYANTNDINKIIDNVLERGDNYFWMIWQRASSREGRLLIILLAREADDGQGKIFSLVDLKKAFEDFSCPYDPEKMRQALNFLQQEEIIEANNAGQLFSIPIDLIRIWLQQHTTPDRIAREEFTTGK